MHHTSVSSSTPLIIILPYSTLHPLYSTHRPSLPHTTPHNTVPHPGISAPWPSVPLMSPSLLTLWTSLYAIPYSKATGTYTRVQCNIWFANRFFSDVKMLLSVSLSSLHSSILSYGISLCILYLFLPLRKNVVLAKVLKVSLSFSISQAGLTANAPRPSGPSGGTYVLTVPCCSVLLHQRYPLIRFYNVMWSIYCTTST